MSQFETAEKVPLSYIDKKWILKNLNAEYRAKYMIKYR